MTYSIDFQSGGTENSPVIPGKTNIELPQNTSNSTATSLVLTGKGVQNYGEIQQENFVKLLENFASNTAPQFPTVGQIWFDTVSNTLNVFALEQLWKPISSVAVSNSAPSSALLGSLWYHTGENILYSKVDATNTEVNASHPIYYTTWAQVWPAVNVFAGIQEYNRLAGKINRVVGTPQQDTLKAGSDKWGWGQNDLLPIFNNVNDGGQFDNNAWTLLNSRLRKAQRHTETVEQAPSIGLISDGRGHVNALADTYSPSAVHYAGWRGLGTLEVTQTHAQIDAAVDELEDNRFTISPLDTQWNITTDTRGAWNQTKEWETALTFASVPAAEAFFNAGGAIRFNFYNTGGTNTLALKWAAFLSNYGLSPSSPGAGLLFNAFGTKRVNGDYVNAPSSSSSIGFYDVTTTYQLLFAGVRADSTVYSSEIYTSYSTISDGGLEIKVRKVLGATANDPVTLQFAVSFKENPDVSGELVNGVTTATMQLRRPVLAGVVAGQPFINSPVLPDPIVATSGTFITAPNEAAS